ncbi:hypothetical protein EUZ85_08235 [Hahella sp. KA22]|uniref:hypothetical protein n=1 Tax=Hahella sp. KA22 TaxID=1628392 RepID=UPI000FDF2BB7|nr:hypothetical protein [Hahella sp. KA22]AZZ90701.1 hypothetical protein ENC22_05685 [Hahella sp. KA22]QAY54071.1 hypothetical protein EUZ85_08235 [Hahella sp. KA22]
MDEEALTKDLISRISNDFEILREVDGFHQFYEQSVRIDLVLKAKPHLIEQGFTNEWFGIECKWVTGVLKQTSKTTRLVWQSITYAQSLFNINGSWEKLRFVAVYTPPHLESSIEANLTRLLELGHYGCVGRFHFYKHYQGWCIRFVKVYASTNGELYISQPQLPKIRAGSV